MATLKKRGNIWFIRDQSSGRDTAISTGESSWQAAKKQLAEYEIKSGRVGAVVTSTPIGEVVETYLVHRKQTLAPQGYKDTVNAMRLLFGPVCQSLKQDPNNKQQQGAIKRWKRDDGSIYTRIIRKPTFEEITTRDISDWLRDRVQHQSWGPVTANHKRTAAVSFWKWALTTYGLRRTEGESQVNPVMAVQTYPKVAPEISWMNRHQIKHQLDNLDSNKQVQAMVATYIYAGLRLSEVLHLQQQDISIDRKLIFIRQKMTPNGMWRPKRNRNRVVPISSDLLPYIKQQLTSTKIVTDNWFFPSPEGLLWNKDVFGRKLRQLNAAKKLTWSPKIYRHTFASILIQKGESAEHIASLMGNSPDVVRRYYGALLNEHMTDVIEFTPKLVQPQLQIAQ